MAMKDPGSDWKDLSDSTSDVEKGAIGTHEEVHEKGLRKWLNDWKPVTIVDDTQDLTRYERATLGTTNVPLKKHLKSRHIQMIAIGGSLGAGLFIGLGNTLSKGGPAGVLIGYLLVGLLLFMTMTALGELGVRYPVAGAFSAYNSRFLYMPWGFAVGVNYAIGWLLALPTELVAAAISIGYWDSDNNGATNVNKAAWVALFYGLVIFINVFGVRGYGEAEFIMSWIKVITVIGFIILGIILTCGGGPNHHYYGGTYWHHPGAFASGAKGVFTVFVGAAYAYSGCEFAGLAAMETDHPHKALPRATKQVFWRILLFYCISIILVGCLVPYTDKRLGSASNASASPFVLAIYDAGIHALPSIINVVIIIAVISVGNAAVFGSSRTIVSLASQGNLPKFFMYIDRQGRPTVALALAAFFGLLGFVCASPNYKKAWSFLSNIGGLSGILTWLSICLCHVRHRGAMKAQGIPLSQLEYKAPFGIWGSLLGVILATLILGLQFWVALFPIGSKGKANAYGFFETWTSACIILVLFIGHLSWFRDPWIATKDLDITTGIRVADPLEIERIKAEDKAYIDAKGTWYKVYRFLC